MPGPAASPTSSRAEALAELVSDPLAAASFLARACAAAPAIEVSLRVLGYRRTLGWIERVPRRTRGSGVSVVLGERLVRKAYFARPAEGTCLPRSLVQYMLHLRDGVPARLVVGVRRPANETAAPSIEAHAWVEGDTTAPASAGSFAPIFIRGDSDGAPLDPGRRFE
ncbi:MAG: lasso peptide biosynthesis B2 protein [Polyangiaceae bacterium]